jgi:hypothetical protein
VVAALCKLLQINDDDASLPLSAAETKLLTAFHNALHHYQEFWAKRPFLFPLLRFGIQTKTMIFSTSTRRPSDDALGTKLCVAIGQVNDQHSTMHGLSNVHGQVAHT